MIRGAPIELALEIIAMIRPPGVSVNTRFIAELCMEMHDGWNPQHPLAHIVTP